MKKKLLITMKCLQQKILCVAKEKKFFAWSLADCQYDDFPGTFT